MVRPRKVFSTGWAAMSTVFIPARWSANSPIQKPTDLYDDPHLLASGGLLTMTEPNGNKVVVPGLPMSVDGERFGLRSDPPPAGSSSEEVLASIDVSAEELEALKGKGIVGG